MGVRGAAAIDLAFVDAYPVRAGTSRSLDATPLVP
jgi:hypothetical protein